ncbi:putative PEP-binding protein [Streptomyces sp. NPDC090499]|uniref:putative PEP-binding protein n=1 Tax=unclassified Streptomyces TaxID=2593676 RepID=UPI0037F5BCB4
MEASPAGTPCGSTTCPAAGGVSSPADLAQYTMATDQLQGDLAGLLDPWQPAVLHLVAEVLHATHEAGKPAGVCGESAADPLMALVLTGLGAASLSMAPAAVLAVRFMLSRHGREQCTQIAGAALAAGTSAAARDNVLALADPEAGGLLSLG